MDLDIYNDKNYVRSRYAYAARCTLEYLITVLVGDAFLAKVLTRIGISDSFIGIISSLVSLAFVVQAISVFSNRKVKSSKKTVTVFDSLGHLLFFGLYLLPFFPIKSNMVKIYAMLFILVGYGFKYYVFGMAFSWGNSFVNPQKRASYSSTKEIISLVSGIFFTFFSGYAFDCLEESKNPDTTYLFLAISVFVINIFQFISFLCMDEKPEENTQQSNKTVKDVLSYTFGNSAFKKVVIMNSLYRISIYFSLGFIGVYKTNTLAISMFVIQIINIAANIFRIIFSVPFGKYSDKHSFAKGYELALIILAIGYAFGIFANPAMWWFIIAYTLMFNLAMAGTNQNSFNIIYSYVDANYITEALCIDQCISGILGFLASVLGGAVLQIIQNGGNEIFGLTVYPQQVLLFASFAVTVIDIVFVRRKILPIKVIKQ